MVPRHHQSQKEHDMTTQVEWANIGWRSAMRDKLFVESRKSKADPVKLAKEMVASAPAWVHKRSKAYLVQSAEALARRQMDRADRKDLYDF